MERYPARVAFLVQGVHPQEKTKGYKRTAYWRRKEDTILAFNLKELNKEILKVTGLVSSSDIEEMKEIIEDLANWELNEQ